MAEGLEVIKTATMLDMVRALELGDEPSYKIPDFRGTDDRRAYEGFMQSAYRATLLGSSLRPGDIFGLVQYGRPETRRAEAGEGAAAVIVDLQVDRVKGLLDPRASLFKSGPRSALTITNPAYEADGIISGRSLTLKTTAVESMVKVNDKPRITQASLLKMIFEQRGSDTRQTPWIIGSGSVGPGTDPDYPDIADRAVQLEPTQMRIFEIGSQVMRWMATQPKMPIPSSPAS